MNYSVIPTTKFKKEAKRLVKKYPSLKEELAALNAALEIHPDMGTPLGNETYKIRMSIRSKGKGKSGGARVITYKVTDNKEIYLLTIYDKSELDSLDDKVIKSIIRNISADS